MHFYKSKYSNKKNRNGKYVFPITASIIFALTVMYWNNESFGLSLEYNGQKIATVTDEKVYQKAEHLVKKQTSLIEKKKINSLSPEIKLTTISMEECFNEPEVLKNVIIENVNEILNPAFSVYIDGKLITVAKTKEEIDLILNDII